MLEQIGFNVTEATDGSQGLQVCAERRFDLVLVDQFMPVMDGLEFISNFRIEAQHADIPVILCSSDGRPQLMRAAVAAGADSYLNKPYTASGLHRRLRDLRLPPA